MDQVLECVDEFAALYVDAVLRLCKQRKIDAMKVTFLVGKAPYRFPPKMVIDQGETKEIILSFEIPYKDESNYAADAFASNINGYLIKAPEHDKQIMKRTNLPFGRICILN